MLINYLNKDCLKFLSDLETDSVDLIITDPPYFIGFDRGKGWDSQWANEKDYLDWCALWIKECSRVLKKKQDVNCLGDS